MVGNVAPFPPCLPADRVVIDVGDVGDAMTGIGDTGAAGFKYASYYY